jgi:hypothetical protein
VAEILPDVGPPPPMAAEGGRFRLFDAVATFLRNAAAGQPLMLVLDDLHAADPMIADPARVDPAPFEREAWARRKNEAHFWQRTKRTQLRTEVRQDAQQRAAQLLAMARAEQAKQQADANAWWDALSKGDEAVLTAALRAAFADNPAPVNVINAAGTAATLVVDLPGPDVLPDKMPHVTPSGRLSSKAWPKTVLNQVYAALLGAHLLATMRETWAVAPSLRNVRVIGIRMGADATHDVVFDLDVDRSGGGWDNDDCGETLLGNAQWGLNRTGTAQEVRPWPLQKLRPDVLSQLE